MKHIITLALLVFAIAAKAQVAQIVSTDGGRLSTSTISIDYTIGDIAVDAYQQSTLRWFEGFQAINYAVGLVTGLESETRFAFYPNPAEKFLTIDSDFTTGSTFRVTDFSGKDVDLPIALSAHRAVVDVSSLAPSMYVLTIQDESGFIHRVKFIKGF